MEIGQGADEGVSLIARLERFKAAGEPEDPVSARSASSARSTAGFHTPGAPEERLQRAHPEPIWLVGLDSTTTLPENRHPNSNREAIA